MNCVTLIYNNYIKNYLNINIWVQMGKQRKIKMNKRNKKMFLT